MQLHWGPYQCLHVSSTGPMTCHALPCIPVLFPTSRAWISRSWMKIPRRTHIHSAPQLYEERLNGLSSEAL